MPRVATFCPRCGESIDTQVPEEAKRLGRAELVCPSCRFRFVIAPAAPPSPPEEGPGAGAAAAGEEPGPESGSKPQSEPGGREETRGAPEPSPGPQREEPRDPGEVQERPLEQEGPGFPQATDAQPAHKGRSGSLPARLLSAGLLLFFAAALGIFAGIIFSSAPAIFEESLQGPPGSGEIEGSVSTPDRNGIEGATVLLLEPVEEGARPDLQTPAAAETTTDAEGAFRMTNVDPGERWLRVQQEGYRTSFMLAWVFSSADGQPAQPGLGAALWEVSLVPGDPSETDYQEQQVDLLNGMMRFFQVWGWVAIPAGVLAAVGGVLVLLRRSFAGSVTAAVAGIISFGFLVGFIMAIIALILILTAKREFVPLRKKNEEQSEPWQ